MRRFAVAAMLMAGCSVEQPSAEECTIACAMLDECFWLGLGYSHCPEQCRGGGGESLIECMDAVAATDPCRSDPDVRTCGLARNCLQASLGIEHGELRPVTARLVAATEVLIAGQEPLCPDGVCESLLSCVHVEGEPFPSEWSAWMLSSPPIELCEQLGIQSMWFAIEPDPTEFQVPESLEPPRLSEQLSCLEAMEQGAVLDANPGRVVLSVHAKGTLPSDPTRGESGGTTDYCWMLARGPVDVDIGGVLPLPLRSAEQIMEEWARPCIPSRP